MNALTQDALPAALAARLTEEQRQAVLEAPRAQRLAVIAAAFGLPEPDMLARRRRGDAAGRARRHPPRPALARPHAGAPRARLPGRARSRPRAPPRTGGGRATAAAPDAREVLHLATVWPPNEVMLDWVRTFTPRPLAWHLALPDRVHQLIIEHYGVGSGSLEDTAEDFAPVQNPQARRRDRRRGRRRRALRQRRHHARRSPTPPPTSISSRRRASCASATASTACSCPCPCRRTCCASRTRSSRASRSWRG